MSGLVLFGTGSTVIADVEESAARAGLTVVAAVRNRPGDCHAARTAPIVSPDALDAAMRATGFLVPLFTPGHRQVAVGEAHAAGLATGARLVDTTTAAPRSLQIGAGSYVNAGCTLGAGTSIGEWVFVNRGANVGHHSRLDDFASIGPGAVMGGHVRIGRGAVIGTGATILPGLSIGANAVVSGGTVVTRDVPDGALVAGHPGRIVRRDYGGYHGLPVR